MKYFAKSIKLLFLILIANKSYTSKIPDSSWPNPGSQPVRTIGFQAGMQAAKSPALTRSEETNCPADNSPKVLSFSNSSIASPSHSPSSSSVSHTPQIIPTPSLTSPTPEFSASHSSTASREPLPAVNNNPDKQKKSPEDTLLEDFIETFGGGSSRPDEPKSETGNQKKTDIAASTSGNVLFQSIKHVGASAVEFFRSTNTVKKGYPLITIKTIKDLLYRDPSCELLGTNQEYLAIQDFKTSYEIPTIYNGRWWIKSIVYGTSEIQVRDFNYVESQPSNTDRTGQVSLSEYLKKWPDEAKFNKEKKAKSQDNYTQVTYSLLEETSVSVRHFIKLLVLRERN